MCIAALTAWEETSADPVAWCADPLAESSPSKSAVRRVAYAAWRNSTRRRLVSRVVSEAAPGAEYRAATDVLSAMAGIYHNHSTKRCLGQGLGSDRRDSNCPGKGPTALARPDHAEP